MSSGTMAVETSRLETPSGKGARDENFPVGSVLLPARLRPHVARYYAFARAIDDIADNPDLRPADKIERLERMDRALLGENTEDPALAKATDLRASMLATGVPLAHARDLIVAFKQDALKSRYEDWADLMGYCRHSASPVGRFLLELHGEDPAGFVASDALCNALQVINHLQDCAEDFRELDRVYLPGDWMDEAGIDTSALCAPAASAGLRQVIERCLDGVDALLAEARRLPGCLRTRGLAMESAAIVTLAERLALELRARDPIAERVELTKFAFLWCCARGVGRALFGDGKRRADGDGERRADG